MNEFDSTPTPTVGTRTEPARIAAALAAAVDRYGPSLFLDQERLKILLHQNCPDAAREITLVVTALGEDVPQRLLGAHSDEELQHSLPGLVDGLVKNAVFDRKSAIWAVKVWAGALALPVTGLLAKPAVRSPLPSYDVNFAAIVTPLSVTPDAATRPPFLPASTRAQSAAIPVGEMQAAPAEPALDAAEPTIELPEVAGLPAAPAASPHTIELPPAVPLPDVDRPVIETVEQIVVEAPAPPPVPEAAAATMPDVSPQGVPPEVRRAPPATPVVPDVLIHMPATGVAHEASRRGGFSPAARNALGVGAVLAAVAIAVLLFRPGGFPATRPTSSPEVLAPSQTATRPTVPVTPIAAGDSATPAAPATASLPPPPPVTPPATPPVVEVAAAPSPQTQDLATTPQPVAPASAIASVEVPRIVAGKPFVVGINLSGSQDHITAIESKVVDHDAPKADDAKLSPLADLKRSAGGAWLVPFKAIDAPSRGTLRLALVDSAGQRSASKNVELQVGAAPAGPSTGSPALPACTRSTCGDVVSVREMVADKNFEVIVRMDDRSIRTLRESARLPVGSRVQQTGGRYVARGAEPKKKAAPARGATKAPDIFGSMF